MAIELIDKIKQKNGGTFKLVDSEDVAFGEHSLTEEIDSVKTQLSQKANKTELETVNSRIEYIIANNNDTDGNTELIDMRVDSLGVVHGTAGSALRNIDNKVNCIVEAYKTIEYNNPSLFDFSGCGDDAWLHTSEKITLKNSTWKEYEKIFIAIELSFANLPQDASFSSENLFIRCRHKENIDLTTSSTLLDETVSFENDKKYVIRCAIELDSEKTNSNPTGNVLFVQFGKSSVIGKPTVKISNLFISDYDGNSLEEKLELFDIFGFEESLIKKIDYTDISTFNKPRIDGKLLTNETSILDFEDGIKTIINKSFDVVETLKFDNKSKYFNTNEITCDINGGSVEKVINDDNSVSFTASATTDSSWFYTNNIQLPDFEWESNHTYLIAMQVVLDEITDWDDHSSGGNYNFNLLSPSIKPHGSTTLGDSQWKSNIATIGATTDLISINKIDEGKLSEAVSKNSLILQIGKVANATTLTITIKDICVMDLTELNLSDSRGIDVFNTYKYTKDKVSDYAYNLHVKSSESAEVAKKALSVENINIGTDIEIWGDSLVAQGYGEIIGKMTGRTVLTKGYGGKTSTYIRDMFLQDSNVNKVQIINVGRNNYDKPDIVLQDIRAMVEAIPHNNFLICCPPNGNYGEGIGTDNYKYFKLIEDRLCKQYPANFLNTREATIQDYDMGNVKLTQSFKQPEINSQVTIHVSDAKFLTTINTFDESRWGTDFMNKIVIGESIYAVDVYKIDSFNTEENTMVVTLVENNSNIKPGGNVANGVDSGGLNSIRYCRVLQYADYYCYINDITQSTFRRDSIHMSDSGLECIAKTVVRKLNSMKI